MFVPVVTVLLVLLTTSDSSLVFVPVCCAAGETGYPDCRPANVSSPAPTYDSYPRPQSTGASFSNYKYTPIDCPYGSTYISPTEYTIRQDGTLEDNETKTAYPSDQYCTAEYFELDDVVVPFVCLPPEEQITNAYPIGMMLSVPFILATIFTYTILSRLHNLHGFCLIFHCSSLAAAYIFLITIQLYTDDLHQTVCVTFGFAVQFFFLATFFWLNIMCIDIYWVFSGFKLLRGSASERDRKKLLFYSLYAWGVPLLISTMTVGVDYSGVLPDNSIYKPNVGTVKCFLVGRTAQWVYLYGPMGVIIICNSVLYTITAIRLFRHRRETAVLKRGDSRKHDGNEKERFNLYLKLFVVMGINWLAELASFIFGENTPKEMWYVTDVANTLQGLFIFLIFVCKQRVRRLVWKKLCKSRSQSNGGPRESIQTTQTSSSSNNSNSMKLKQVFFSCCFDSKADKEENKPTQKPCEIPTLSVDISGKYSDLKQTSLS